MTSAPTATSPSSTHPLLSLFTIAHPFVDACSFAVLLAVGPTLLACIAYNALAFALQLPLGLLLDRRPRLLRPAFHIGILLVAAAALALAAGLRTPALLLPACTGNALFHLAAGKHVLDAHPGRAAPVALFISTGALGLLAGQSLPSLAPLFGPWPLPFLAGSLVLLALVATLLWPAPASADPAPALAPLPPRAVLPLALLTLLVAWRGWAALVAGRASFAPADSPATPLFLATVPVLACLGKAVGGYLGDRFGRCRLTAASVCGSAVLAALALLGRTASPTAWLPLLFLAQLATGPVLSLLHDRARRRGGLAFGLNCLALFLGSIG